MSCIALHWFHSLIICTSNKWYRDDVCTIALTSILKEMKTRSLEITHLDNINLQCLFAVENVEYNWLQAQDIIWVDLSVKLVSECYGLNILMGLIIDHVNTDRTSSSSEVRKSSYCTTVSTGLWLSTKWMYVV